MPYCIKKLQIAVKQIYRVFLNIKVSELFDILSGLKVLFVMSNKINKA